MGRAGTNKRERLVKSAVKLFHRHGVQATSIADIARDAEIPVGNVFYYFRTKDALVRAVVDHWLEEIDSRLDSLRPDDPPKSRLAAFLQLNANGARRYASVGCPIVALVRDLKMSGSALAPIARELASRQLEWVSARFRAMGVDRNSACSEAQCFIATIQGSFQLAFALGEPGVILASVTELERRLETWVRA